MSSSIQCLSTVWSCGAPYKCNLVQCFRRECLWTALHICELVSALAQVGFQPLTTTNSLAHPPDQPGTRAMWERQQQKFIERFCTKQERKCRKWHRRRKREESKDKASSRGRGAPPRQPAWPAICNASHLNYSSALLGTDKRAPLSFPVMLAEFGNKPIDSETGCRRYAMGGFARNAKPDFNGHDDYLLQTWRTLSLPLSLLAGAPAAESQRLTQSMLWSQSQSKT